jgi:hypothetical protein
MMWSREQHQTAQRWRLVDSFDALEKEIMVSAVRWRGAHRTVNIYSSACVGWTVAHRTIKNIVLLLTELGNGAGLTNYPNIVLLVTELGGVVLRSQN